MSDAESAVPTRLWFRCDEVTPLAEHAMACRPHLTRAQVLAGQRLIPGLQVHHRAGTAVLSSNGTPTWHDPAGAMRHATALTWQHTGRRRHRIAPARDAFLPLHPGHAENPPMIDLIRAARHRRQHWMAITVHRVRGHLITADAITFTDHRAEPPPADTIWTPATVTPDLADHTYPALTARNYRIGKTPPARFDRPTVERMVTDLQTVWDCPDRNRDPMPGEYPVLRFDGAVLIAYDTHDSYLDYAEPDAPAGVGLDEIDRYRPDRDGFYPVGAFLWSWHRTAARMPLAARLRLSRTAVAGRLRARYRRAR